MGGGKRYEAEWEEEEYMTVEEYRMDEDDRNENEQVKKGKESKK